MADTPVLVLPGVVGTVNAGGGGALKSVLLSIGLGVSGQISYGTFAAGNIGFQPKFALCNISSNTMSVLIDIENKRMYGTQGSSLDVIFPDGSALAMGMGGWPSSGSAVTPKYGNYGGIEYAYVENNPGYRWYARSVWFHPDGSVRVFCRNAYDGADWTGYRVFLIG